MAAAGCRSTAVGPSALTTIIIGNVSNSLTGPIDRALVTVTDGQSAGATTLTGPDGSFTLTYNSTSVGHLQVTKEGYTPTTVLLPAGSRGGEIAIALHVAMPPVNLAGTYTATFIADAACSQIPAALRTRVYTAAIDQAAQFPQSTRFQATLSGAEFAAGTSRVVLNSFYGFVEGRTVGLDVANLFDDSDVAQGIAEQIAPGTRLEIFGKATLTVADPASVATPMTGYFAVTDASGSRTCSSSNHLLRLTRQP